MEQKEGIDRDLAGAEPQVPPPSVDDNSKNGNEDGQEKDLEISTEFEADPKKKKSSSKSGKKGRKGFKRKPSPKTSWKQLTDDVGTILCKSEHTAMAVSKRRSSTSNKKSNRQSRRQSTSSMVKNLASDSTTRKQSDNNYSVPNPTDGTNYDSTDNDSFQSQSNSNNSFSGRSFGSFSSQKSQNRFPSNRSFDGFSSQKSQHRLPSNRSCNSLSSQKSQNRLPSNRSFGSLSSQKSQLISTTNHSFDSAHSRNSLSQLSSTLSIYSNSKNPKLGAHISNSERKKKNCDGVDFDSDIEDETTCSIDNMNFIIGDGVKPLARSGPSSAKDSNPFEEKKNNCDPDTKPKKKRQPQLSQTDESGRGLSHYKLEGVYYNQKKEPSLKNSTKNDPEENDDIEVLTKPPADSNRKDIRNKTPITGRFRSRRRGSLGNDELLCPRSRSNPRSRSSPRSRSRELTSPRSRSRELTSSRNNHKGLPSAQKDFTRSQDGPSSRNSQIMKNNDKRVRRDSGANIISPESKEGVKKIFGTDAALSEDDTIVVKNTTSESQPSSAKNAEENPLIKIENQLPPNLSLKEEKEGFRDAEEVSGQITATSESLENKQRRRSSMGRPMKNDRAPAQPQDATKEFIELGNPLAEENLHVTLSANEEILMAVVNTTSGDQPSSLKEAKKSIENTGEVRKKSKPPSKSKSLDQKQHRRSNVGKAMKNDIAPAQPQDAMKEFIELGNPLAEENLHVTLSANEEILMAVVNTTSGDQPSSLKEAKKSIENTGEVRKKSKPPSKSKSLDQKQHKRSSVGKTLRKNRTPTQSVDAAKELIDLGSPLSEDGLIVPKSTDHETLVEIENTESSTAHLSTSLIKNNEDPAAENESSSSSTVSLNDTEKSSETIEKLNKKIDSPSRDVEKKQRRQSSMGKVAKKYKTSTRISNKSGHKFPKRSTREKKYRTKDSPTLKADSSTGLTSPSAVADFVAGNEKEINELLKQDTKDLAKRRNNTEMTSKKDESSSRRSSVKEKKNREKEPLPTEAIPQIDLSSDNDPNSEVKTSGNSEPTIAASANESSPEKENKIDGIWKEDVFIPASLHDMLSRHSSKRELISICTDTGSFYSASLASGESEEKDDENVDGDKYLQLTFVTQNGTDGNNLFARMDEKFNRSLQEMEGQPETEDMNFSHTSFFSYTDEIELKVSTTSYSLSKSAHIINNTDDISVDDAFPADSNFPYDDDGFAHDSSKETTTKKKIFLTPISIKKKVSPFSLSKSLHSPGLHSPGLYNDNSFGDGTGAASPRRKKRGSMLQKMKTGISEGGKRTFQKAASTRSLFEQATTKVMSRRKEEGRGLLRNDSD